MAEKRRFNSLTADESLQRAPPDHTLQDQPPPATNHDPNPPKRIKSHHHHHPSTRSTNPNPISNRTRTAPQPNQTVPITSSPTMTPTNSINHPAHQPTRSIQNQRMADAATDRIIKSKPSSSLKLNLNDLSTTNTPTIPATMNEPIPSSSSPPSHQLLEQIQNLKNQIETINKTVSNYKDVIDAQTNLIDSIKSSLSCNICFEILDSPYALLCGHIFCHRDLYAWFHRANPSPANGLHPSDDENSDHLIEMPIQSSGSEGRPSGSYDSNDSSTRLNLLFRPGHRLTNLSSNGPNQADQSLNRSTSAVGATDQRPAGNLMRPLSPQRRKTNLVCPQCRAEVTRRPMALYAIKEAADRLKTNETPSPSCLAPTGSFRNQVELHRDEKDLTWGRLFEESDDRRHRDRPTNRFNSSHRPLVIEDLDDGVRRCGRCSWEIGIDGTCVGCGAFYSDLAEEESSDDSYQVPSVESEDSGSNQDTDDDEEEGQEDANLWGRSMIRLMGFTTQWPDGLEAGHLDQSSSHDEEEESGDDSDVRVIRRRIPNRIFEDSDEDVHVLNRRSSRNGFSNRSDQPPYAPFEDDSRHDQSMRTSDDDRPIYRTGLAIASRPISSSNSQEEGSDEDEDDRMNGDSTSNQSEVGSFVTHDNLHRPNRTTSSSDQLSSLELDSEAEQRGFRASSSHDGRHSSPFHHSDPQYDEDSPLSLHHINSDDDDDDEGRHQDEDENSDSLSSISHANGDDDNGDDNQFDWSNDDSF